MAQYNMIKEVKEIKELSGKTMEELKSKFDATGDMETEFIVWNRREQNSVLETLSDLKAKVKKEEVKKEISNNYGWKKDVNYGWIVYGDFTDKKEGDFITVVKVSGAKEEKVISEILSSTEAQVR